MATARLRASRLAPLVLALTSLVACGEADPDDPFGGGGTVAPGASGGAVDPGATGGAVDPGGTGGAVDPGGTGGDLGAFQPTGVGLLRVSGDTLVDPYDNPVQLRGVAFGNEVWSNPVVPTTIHHSEADYARVAALGFNSVRFYLNYGLLEDGAGGLSHVGVDWLDQNVRWAHAAGLRLVVNLHVPPGGIQSNGDGGALWDDAANQARTLALWRALAARYADEGTIAGWGLINEPRPTADLQQWQTLAEQLAGVIRQVDPGHVLFVERALSAGDTFFAAGDGFIQLADPNTVYEFHFYEPFAFTHQKASWTQDAEGNLLFPESAYYPDPNAGEASGEPTWEASVGGTAQLAEGTSGWQEYVGAPVEITQGNIGQVVFECSGVGAGTGYADQVRVDEYDASDSFVRTVFDEDLESSQGWFFWTQDGSGSASYVAAHDGNGVAITGTSSAAVAGNWQRRFLPVAGHKYAISGWMSGAAIPAGASCRLRFDAMSGTITRRDKAGLQVALDRYLSWGRARGVPMYLGEFGVINFGFETDAEGNDYGGTTWVTDMLDLLADANGTSWNYHTYHEPAFGIYTSGDALPSDDQVNAPLRDLFQSKLLP